MKITVQDKADIIKLAELGMKTGDIAKKYKVSYTTIYNVINNKYGNSNSIIRKGLSKNDIERLIMEVTLNEGKGYTSTGLAIKYGVSKEQIRYVLKKYNLKLDNHYKIVSQEDKICIYYQYVNGVAPKKLAKEFNTTIEYIYYIVAQFEKVDDFLSNIEDFEINIDGYVKVISKLSKGKGYLIKYKDKGRETTTIIDKESVLGLAELGYTIGYHIGSNEYCERYLQAVQTNTDKILHGKLSENDVIKHITNLKSLPDKKVYKLKIKKLIFGDCNILKEVEVELNNKTKLLSIDEYTKFTLNKHYSAYHNDYIRLAKNSLTVDYKSEYDEFINSNICKARIGHILNIKVLRVPINGQLNYITAKTLLKDSNIKLVLDYSENQKQIDKFIKSLKRYRKSIELSKDDNINITRFYGVSGMYNGVYELRVGNNRLLTDTSFSSSSLYRKIAIQKIDVINLGNIVKCIETSRSYDNQSKKTKFTMKVDYDLLESMKTIETA